MSKTNWLELKQDEEVVREFSFQKANVVLVAIGLGLAMFAGLGVFYLYRAAPVSNDLPWILIANASMIVLVAIILAVKLSGSKSAVLTNKNLLVRTGRGVAALPLARITGLQLGRGLAKKKVLIFAGGNAPAVTLVSEEPDEMLEEIAVCCQAAGARLRN